MQPTTSPETATRSIEEEITAVTTLENTATSRKAKSRPIRIGKQKLIQQQEMQ